MKILGIESSCDETAAAVVEDGRTVLSNIVASQVPEHKLYGGVVPEIASRRHCEAICGVVREALESAGTGLSGIDAVAVTYAPGLIGALLVGVNFAKGLSLAAGKPLIPVHHLRSHIAANYLTFPELEPPFLCLVVSGGHTHIVTVDGYTELRVLGRTRDDAAGEAFDKAARAMGIPYPGGVFPSRPDKERIRVSSIFSGSGPIYESCTAHARKFYSFVWKSPVIHIYRNIQKKLEIFQHYQKYTFLPLKNHKAGMKSRGDVTYSMENHLYRPHEFCPLSRDQDIWQEV